MSVANKVKTVMQFKGKDHAGLAAHLGISKQALSNKFYRDSFSAVDLIKIAEYTECPIAFIANDNMNVVLDRSDIK